MSAVKKRIALIGGFQKTRSLAGSLIKQGYAVTAINDNRAHCEELAEIRQLSVFNGDGTKPYILEDASIYGFDIAIAMAGRDDDNFVICQLCKKKFSVSKTVALIGDPSKTEFFYRMGIDSVVCEITSVTSIIEQQAFLDEIATLVPIGDGRIKISQIPIPDGAPAADLRVMDISLPKNALIGCIMRGGTGMIPRGGSIIRAGDVLVLISSDEHETAAVHALTGR
ncbi:MAG: TrkA family potassium uptake protein [Oscillospiraceae bacterium]|jgi:trk system potassium uptake protein TrkA|nr:TrkA family potassium uptake protein [Oscillospiraceae bacterium]